MFVINVRQAIWMKIMEICKKLNKFKLSITTWIFTWYTLKEVRYIFNY